MATSTFPQTWDLTPFAPAPASPEFREQLEQFKHRLRTLAIVSDQLPTVKDDRDSRRDLGAVDSRI